MKKKWAALILGLFVFSMIGAFYFGDQTGYETGYADGEEKGWDDGYFTGINEGWVAGLEAGQIIGYADGLVDGKESGYNLGFSEGYEAGIANTGEIAIGGQGYLVSQGTIDFMLQSMIPYMNTLLIVGTEEHPAFIWMSFIINTGSHGEYLTFQYILVDPTIENTEERVVIESLVTPDENGKFDISYYYEIPYESELFFGFFLYDERAEAAQEEQFYGYKYVTNWDYMFGEWVFVRGEVEVPEAEVIAI